MVTEFYERTTYSRPAKLCLYIALHLPSRYAILSYSWWCIAEEAKDKLNFLDLTSNLSLGESKSIDFFQAASRTKAPILIYLDYFFLASVASPHLKSNMGWAVPNSYRPNCHCLVKAVSLLFPRVWRKVQRRDVFYSYTLTNFLDYSRGAHCAQQTWFIFNFLLKHKNETNVNYR